jgi:hypothetical protein
VGDEGGNGSGSVVLPLLGVHLVNSIVGLRVLTNSWEMKDGCRRGWSDLLQLGSSLRELLSYAWQSSPPRPKAEP